MKDFQRADARHFRDCPTKLVTTIKKLWQKYKWFNMEWSKKTNRAKNGSGLDPDKESH